jgi:hypothetical protein
MSPSHDDQAQRAWDLHQSGYSLEQVAVQLNTSDDRASQLIAAFQRQQPTEPELPWWHGLSPSNRILLEDVGLHSRTDVEQAYRDGAFTRGHPNFLSGFSARRIQRIIEWLGKSPEPPSITYRTVETLTLRLNAERVRELEALSRAAHVEPAEIVERLISNEASQKGIKGKV